MKMEQEEILQKYVNELAELLKSDADEEIVVVVGFAPKMNNDECSSIQYITGDADTALTLCGDLVANMIQMLPEETHTLALKKLLYPLYQRQK